MEKVAIFISDLHLGRGDELDDFVEFNENAFMQFLAHQSERHRSKDLDLVFLGDSFDIWQVASEKEKTAIHSSDIEIAIRPDGEQDRVQQIISAHLQIFKALGQFLEVDVGRRRIVFTTGNHDHSLIHPGIQGVVREAITTIKSVSSAYVLFSNYYDEPDLRTYGEHGNQLDDNNRYDNFTAFGSECPGYYFVRVFWNRLECRDPGLQGLSWWNCFQYFWAHHLWRLLKPAWDLWRQYKTDPRSFKRIDVPGMPFFDVEEGKPLPAPVTGKPLPEFPDILLSEGGDPERIFSTDDETENLLRSLYHDPKESGFRESVDQILAEKFHGQPPPVPSEPVMSIPEFGLFHDEYVSAVTGMFAPDDEHPATLPIKGSSLSDEAYDYVLLGHTHDEKKVSLRQLGVLYLNTGSWAAKRDPKGQNVSRLCYVTISKASDGKVKAVQDYWGLK